MDWKRFDRVRSEVGPVHLDLVESYAGGKISRRDFVRRGAVLGLSAPFIGSRG
jgi:peptide/nickel transport system substrate-binding protein